MSGEIISTKKKEENRKFYANFFWSSIYETLPHGVENDQPNYLNTLLLIKSNSFPKPSKKKGEVSFKRAKKVREIIRKRTDAKG